MSEVSTDKLVKAYVKIRDAKDAIRKEYDAKLKNYDEQMDQIKHKLLEQMKETGQNGAKTDFGTVSCSVKTKYWTSDWSAFHKFILENEAPELLVKSINQSNMKAFLDENPDVLPPGLNSDSEYVISVRRPSKK